LECSESALRIDLRIHQIAYVITSSLARVVAVRRLDQPDVPSFRRSSKGKPEVPVLARDLTTKLRFDSTSSFSASVALLDVLRQGHLLFFVRRG